MIVMTKVLKGNFESQILGITQTFKILPLLKMEAKLYTPSTLNIEFIQWHTQLIMCAVK